MLIILSKESHTTMLLYTIWLYVNWVLVKWISIFFQNASVQSLDRNIQHSLSRLHFKSNHIHINTLREDQHQSHTKEQELRGPVAPPVAFNTISCTSTFRNTQNINWGTKNRRKWPCNSSNGLSTNISSYTLTLRDNQQQWSRAQTFPHLESVTSLGWSPRAWPVTRCSMVMYWRMRREISCAWSVWMRVIRCCIRLPHFMSRKSSSSLFTLRVLITSARLYLVIVSCERLNIMAQKQ